MNRLLHKLINILFLPLTPFSLLSRPVSSENRCGFAYRSLKPQYRDCISPASLSLPFSTLTHTTPSVWPIKVRELRTIGSVNPQTLARIVHPNITASSVPPSHQTTHGRVLPLCPPAQPEAVANPDHPSKRLPAGVVSSLSPHFPLHPAIRTRPDRRCPGFYLDTWSHISSSLSSCSPARKSAPNKV